MTLLVSNHDDARCITFCHSLCYNYYYYYYYYYQLLQSNRMAEWNIMNLGKLLSTAGTFNTKSCCHKHLCHVYVSHCASSSLMYPFPKKVPRLSILFDTYIHIAHTTTSRSSFHFGIYTPDYNDNVSTCCHGDKPHSVNC